MVTWKPQSFVEPRRCRYELLATPVAFIGSEGDRSYVKARTPRIRTVQDAITWLRCLGALPRDPVD
jgi:hypothetical protein